MKLLLRSFLSTVLALVPYSFIESLRARYRASKRGTGRRMVYRGVLNVLRHRGLPPSVDVVAIGGPFGGEINVSNDNAALTRRLFYLGEYEGSEWYWWMHWCAQVSSVVELGANTGFYTILGGRSPTLSRYVAVEPHPYTAAVLRRNLQLNRVTRVRVVEAAAVGKPSQRQMTLYVPAGDPDVTPAGAFLETATVDYHRGARDEVLVDLIGARELIDGADLVKLDVEGQEVEVLRSVEDLLSSQRPTIFLEVLERNSQLRAYLPTLCARCGYIVLAIGRNTLFPVAPAEIMPAKLFRQCGTRDVILTTTPPAQLAMVAVAGTRDWNPHDRP